MTSVTRTTPRIETTKTIDTLLNKYSTQITTALAVVVLVSGSMMFFDTFKDEVEALHEWLGLAFVVAVALHLIRHRRPLTTMLAQNRMRIPMVFTAIIAATFIAYSSAKQADPRDLVVDAVLRAPIGDVATVLGVPAEGMISNLTAAGVMSATPAQSIETLAQSSRVEPMELLTTAVGKTTKRK